ncbi:MULTISPECIES: S1/P1 nuclease [unclassified Bradyrhizobium]
MPSRGSHISSRGIKAAISSWSTSEACKLRSFIVWDGILGDRGTAAAAIGAASLLPAADPTLAKIDDPEIWFKESSALAQQYAYGTAVGPDKGPYDLDAAYLSKAKSVAEAQVALAGQRLANLINAALK